MRYIILNTNFINFVFHHVNTISSLLINTSVILNPKSSIFIQNTTQVSMGVADIYMMGHAHIGSAMETRSEYR